MIFNGYKPSGVLSKVQGGIGGFNFISNCGQVGIYGDVVQEEFCLAFINPGFRGFKVAGNVGDDLQVGGIFRGFSGGVGSKIVACNMG
jgi:hypothetical protein